MKNPWVHRLQECAQGRTLAVRVNNSLACGLVFGIHSGMRFRIIPSAVEAIPHLLALLTLSVFADPAKWTAVKVGYGYSVFWGLMEFGLANHELKHGNRYNFKNSALWNLLPFVAVLGDQLAVDPFLPPGVWLGYATGYVALHLDLTPLCQ